MENWYDISDIEQIDSPELIIYPERVKKNILTLKTLIPDISSIRPHVKTHKIKEVSVMMLEAGINKFKCATISEAEMLAMSGAPDILFAYQPTLPKLLRLVDLIKMYPASRFSCLIDNQASADMISSTAVNKGVLCNLYIDLNTGMNRTGIQPGDQAINLYEHCIKLPSIKIKGLHAYDGHIHEKDPGKRKLICDELFSPVESMRSALVQKGYPFPVVVAGGSPTWQIHANRKSTEVSPGTFVFWDKGYQESIPEQNFIPAALILTRVISLPTEDKICLDLGHKSIASENDLQHRVVFLNAPELKPSSHSEEHMVLEAGRSHKFKVGDVLYALPWHVCPTIALYHKATCIKEGKISDEWQIIARNRSLR